MNNNQKATKRALLTSVMALVMCVVMLVGTTFAWFTDTASTGVNKITSGNLHVEIQNGAGQKIENLEWVKENGDVIANQEGILWEPGCTYLLTPFKIVNTGNLALKYKIAITGLDGDSPLLDVIKFTYKTASGEEFDMSAEGHLAANGGSTGMITVSAHMDEAAGNDYMGKTLTGIKFTVYATQDTVENDSFGDQYDKDATYLTYPAGVTDAIFDSKTEVDYSIPGGSTGKAPAAAAYVDSNGNVQYTADVKTALDNGASTIYLKKNTKGRLMALTDFLAQPNRSSDVTKDITIYANGADFEYGELAINTSEAGKNANFTIKVYDAKNLRVWGNTPNAGVTQNIILENCTYEGTGIGTNAAGGIFFAYGETGTINLTMNNCKVSGSNQGVYLGCNGNITVTNSAFEECAAGMKISHKATGVCNVTVKDTTFNKCGCDTAVAEKPWLTNDSSSIKCKTKGTMTLTLDNVAINNVVGNDGIVVDGDTDYTGKTTVSATNVTVDGAAWSANTTNP